MKAFFRNHGLLVFILVAGIQLISIVAAHAELRFMTKLLLMPVLALTVYFASDHPKKYFIIAALAFSFLGDLFLAIEDINPLFFIYGLLSFLIAHVLYIIFFTRLKTPGKSLLRTDPYIPVLVMIYGAGLIYLVYPSLGALKIPVIISAGIICSMLLCTFYVYRMVGVITGLQFVAGASLFVISDSLLAINKFHDPLPFAGFLIMMTYCAAQYLIVRAFLTLENKNNSSFPPRREN